MNEASPLTCLICQGKVCVALTKKQNGVHFKCMADARHFRGFVMDKAYVAQLKRIAESKATQA